MIRTVTCILRRVPGNDNYFESNRPCQAFSPLARRPQVFGYPVPVFGFRNANSSLLGTIRSKRGSDVWMPR